MIKCKLKKLLIILLLFLSFYVTLFDLVLIVNNDLNESKIESIIKQKYFRLVDSYDTQNGNINNFFNEKNSTSTMQKTANKIRNSAELDYYYFDIQNIEYIGNYYEKFGNNATFVLDEDKEYIDQIIRDDFVITPLKSLQVDSVFLKNSGLYKNIQKGICFTNNFILEDTLKLPVVLGNGYSDVFEIGDVFSGCYLGKDNFKFEVVGILKDDNLISKNPLLDIVYDLIAADSLNNYIIIPNCAMKFKSKSNNLLEKILSCQKCEGFLTVDSREDFDLKMNIINNISEETNFKYAINNESSIYKQMSLGKEFVIVSFLIFSIIILIIMLYASSVFKSKVIAFEQKSFLCYVNLVLDCGIYLAASYGLAYYLNLNIFLSKFAVEIDQIALIYFGIIILLFLMCVLLKIVLHKLFLLMVLFRSFLYHLYDSEHWNKV